jgi:hypothetical protein
VAKKRFWAFFLTFLHVWFRISRKDDFMLTKSFSIKSVDLQVMLHMAIFNANNGKEPVIFRKNRPFFEFATNRSSMKTKNDLKKKEMFHSEFTVNHSQLSINVTAS